ncbi:MAG: serine/threonine protein kinase [Bacteroidaceae bacterium]|nr:serine/threonine protein kinase [Bacteroidaceae bacterium]
MQTVVQRPNDPYIYLYAMGEWYCYNPQEPPLGSGAMGDVYCGYRCKNGEMIAVKKVKDAFANNKMIRERARQEASLAFRHPNLVEMVGYCEYARESGPIFILSHYVQGEDIDKYVKRFAGSPNRVEKICSAICAVLDALDYVHSRGVIHRDIKPSNIMVENGSNVRLMDLGIARVNAAGKFSSTGFIGTPEYAAPEQMIPEQNGQTAPINATTDIYALGITFYELLTDRNPMSCDTETATLTKQMKEPLPGDAKIPCKLMQVIWKATEKEQSKRYQRALDFKNAILAALMPEPSLFERVSDWMQEHVLMVVFAAIALALLVFIILILLI